MNINSSVAIIGSGPAGLAAAEIIKQHAPETTIVIFEKGRAPSVRSCPVNQGRDCNGCSGICNVLSGFGGAIQSGDAVKLSRYPAGRRLKALIGARYVEMELAAIEFFGVRLNEFETTKSSFSYPGLRTYPVAEISEGRLESLLCRKFRTLSAECDIRIKSRVRSVRAAGDLWEIESADPKGSRIERFRYVVAGTGRAGIRDLDAWLTENSVARRTGALSVGVRFEMPTVFIKPLYEAHKDFKLSEQSEGLKLKTFCFSAHPLTGGRLKFCNYQDQFEEPIILLDGHTNVLDLHAGPALANLAVLAQVQHEHSSSREWIESSFLPTYMRISSGMPIWQPLSEILGETALETVRPSVQSASKHRIADLIGQNLLSKIVEFYRTIINASAKASKIDAQCVLNQTTVLAPVVEYLWDSVELTSSFESSSPGLFVVGDSAGLAQGALQGAISGIVAGTEIAARFAKLKKMNKYRVADCN